MDFGATVFFFNPRKVLPLEHFFTDIIKKINLCEQHSETTVALYNKEKSDQLKKSKNDYDKAIQIASKMYNEILAMNGDDDFGHSFASHESGIDSIQYNYQDEDEEINLRFNKMNEYFIKSSLVLTYALLESELRGLCKLLQTSLQKRITLNDLSEKDYLKSIFTYLDLIIEIPMTELANKYQLNFKELQFLRNKIMHNGGEFSSNDDNQELNQIISRNSSQLSLLNNTENNSLLLQVKMDYVKKNYIEIKSFFKQLLWLVDEKLSFIILTNKLYHVFNFLASDLTISNIKLKSTNKTKQIMFHLHSKLETKEFNLNCNLSLKQGLNSKVEVLDQVETIEQLKRLKIHLESTPSLLLSQALGIFIYSEENNIKLIISPL